MLESRSIFTHALVVAERALTQAGAELAPFVDDAVGAATRRDAAAALPEPLLGAARATASLDAARTIVRDPSLSSLAGTQLALDLELARSHAFDALEHLRAGREPPRSPNIDAGRRQLLAIASRRWRPTPPPASRSRARFAARADPGAGAHGRRARHHARSAHVAAQLERDAPGTLRETIGRLAQHAPEIVVQPGASTSVDVAAPAARCRTPSARSSNMGRTGPELQATAPRGNRDSSRPGSATSDGPARAHVASCANGVQFGLGELFAPVMHDLDDRLSSLAKRPRSSSPSPVAGPSSRPMRGLRSSAGDTCVATCTARSSSSRTSSSNVGVARS